MVRRLLRPIAGACPMPMQPMQPVWWMRAPACTRSAVAPIRVRSTRICRDVGFTSSDTRGSTWRPFTMAATDAKSRSPGFADEPTTTWWTSSPATSRTGTTSPGELGRAISGSSADRSISSVTS